MYLSFCFITCRIAIPAGNPISILFLCYLRKRHDAFFVRRSAVKSQNRIVRIALHPAQAASVPTDSLVEVMSKHGVCRECYQDFITRWHDAYITEIEEFCHFRRKADGTVIYTD